MRYFAMIDGERRGPFELSQLAEAGVRPDTYVWCKDMADWEKAEDVADICRFYRRRIFDMMHPPERKTADAEASQAENPVNAATTDDPYADVPLRFRQMVRRSDIPPETFRKEEEQADLSRPPMPTLFLSIVMTLFCFPVTGLVAAYYSYKARKAWQESARSESKNGKGLYSDDERTRLRKDAHDFERQAKMWIGVTFFLSIILYALLGNRFM